MPGKIRKFSHLCHGHKMRLFAFLGTFTDRNLFQISQAFRILSLTYSASSNFRDFQSKSRRENVMKQIKPILPF